MKQQQRFENAMRDSDPSNALRDLALEFFSQGLSKSEIYEQFESFLLHLRSAEPTREAEENLLLDTMDALTGDCHPSAHLLPE